MGWSARPTLPAVRPGDGLRLRSRQQINRAAQNRGTALSIDLRIKPWHSYVLTSDRDMDAGSGGMLSRENFKDALQEFIKKDKLTINDVASAIYCPRSSVERILMGVSFPSDAMMKQGGLMIYLGIEDYSKLSDAQKEDLAEKIGAIGGGAIGFGAIGAAVGAMGVVGGVGAAGIAAGLGAMGGLVGGGMAAGIAVAAAIPVAIGAAGFGAVKATKHLIKESYLGSKDFDSKWEVKVL